MAEPTDINAEMLAAAQNAAAGSRRTQDTARRIEAVSLKLAGLSEEQIAERLDISLAAVNNIITRATEKNVNGQVAKLRELENQRLDRLQMAVWSDALKGDQKAIAMILKISDQRAKLNGLYAPTQIQMSVSIQQEMHQALENLETLVLEQDDQNVYRLPGADDDRTADAGRPGLPALEPRELRPFEVPDPDAEGPGQPGWQ